MRRVLVLAVAILAMGWAVNCEAKLGMKMEDLERAYKQPVSTNTDNGMVVRTYHAGGDEVTVTYLDGVSVCESLLSGPDALKLDDATAVEMAGIMANDRKAKWERRKDLDGPKKKAWSAGGDLFAVWEFQGRDRLTVYSKAYTEKRKK